MTRAALEGDGHLLQGQGKVVRAWLQGSRHSRDRAQPELSSINITLKILASTESEGTLAESEKALMQGDPSVREEPLYATPPSEGLQGVPEGALICLDREVYGLVSGMSGWRSRIVSRLIEEEPYEPCLFQRGTSGRRRHDRT